MNKREPKKQAEKASEGSAAAAHVKSDILPSKASAAAANGPKPSSIPAPVVKKHTLYVEVAPDKCFVLCDGRRIKSGKELADILQFINDDMFKYHVNDVKNDFSSWINDVFGEQDLAKKIRAIHNRMEMSVELYRHMFEALEKSGQPGRKK